MKKLLVSALTFTLLATVLLLPVSAAKTAQVEYEIPKAQSAPTIDGVMSDGEWAGAFEKVIDESNADVKEGYEGGTLYWMWDDAGLYFFAKINDSHPVELKEPPKDGQDAVYLADRDAIQFMLYSDKEAVGYAPNANGGVFYFCLVPQCTDGKAYGTEFHTLETFKQGKESVKGYYPMPGFELQSTVSDTGYTLEAFFPKDLLAMCANPIAIKSGEVLHLAHGISYAEGAAKARNAWDAESYNAPNANFYTLTDTPAGQKPAPVTTAPTTAPITTPTPSTTPAATQTADVSIVIALVAASAAAAFVCTKKRTF